MKKMAAAFLPWRELRRQWWWVVGFAYAIALGLASANASASEETPAFVMGFDEDATVFGIRWSRSIHTEAFRRLGIPLEIRFLPLARRAAMLDAGAIDGENARVAEFGDSHPNLLRVDEAIMELGFGLYSADPRLKVERLEDLSTHDWLVESRRGIVQCDVALKKVVPPARLSFVGNEEQGLRKLLSRRTDVYCDLDSVVRSRLATTAFAEAKTVRRVFALGEIPTYPFIHKKHAALAPKLAQVLRQMKREGLVERYRRQAEQETDGGR